VWEILKERWPTIKLALIGLGIGFLGLIMCMGELIDKGLLDPGQNFLLKLVLSILYVLGDGILFLLRIIANLIHSSTLYQFINPLSYKFHPEGDYLSLGSLVAMVGWAIGYIVEKRMDKWDKS